MVERGGECLNEQVICVLILTAIPERMCINGIVGCGINDLASNDV